MKKLYLGGSKVIPLGVKMSSTLWQFFKEQWLFDGLLIDGSLIEVNFSEVGFQQTPCFECRNEQEGVPQHQEFIAKVYCGSWFACKLKLLWTS